MSQPRVRDTARGGGGWCSEGGQGFGKERASGEGRWQVASGRCLHCLVSIHMDTSNGLI